ncbi:MAG: site-specific integrase [Balneolales bacterium]
MATLNLRNPGHRHHPAPEGSLQGILTSYLNYKRKLLSPNSMRSYRNVIRKLGGRISGLNELNRSTANELINAPEAVKTRQLRKAIVDNFIDWAIKEEWMSQAIATEVYATRAEQKKRIITISEREFRILLSGVDDGRVRDVMRVAFYMGLRVSELIHCRAAWITGKGRFLRIGDLCSWGLDDEFHPKSQKEYDIPVAIPGQVRNIFQREAGTDRFSRMFGYHSDSTLRYNVKEYLKALPGNLGETFSVHHLRHSCISYWLNERRVPIHEVQRLARHARLSTTLKYYHPDDEAHFECFN